MEGFEDYKQTLIGVGILLVGIIITLALIQKSTATITINVRQPDSRVYLNSEAHTQTDSPNQTVTLELKEGSHSILVAANNRWPWKKDVTVTGQARQKNWTAFTLPKQASAARISPESDRYSSINARFATSSMPSEDSPILSDDGRVSVWANASGTAVYAKHNSGEYLPAFCSGGECKDTITSFETESPIRHLSFFNGYADLLVYAAGEKVGVREIDPDGTQNVQPIYTSTAPTFRHATGTQLYLTDEDEDLIQVQL